MANDIDIFSLEPHKVSRDLRGYSIMFFGAPKSGKTTMASKFEKSLLIATEKGYSAIPGIIAQPVNTWAEIKKVLRQLKTEKAKEQFYNIIIDTVDLAYNFCEQYIANQNGVQTIADIAYGRGYQLVEKEFDSVLRSIVVENYGLILISHSEDKTFKDESGSEYNQIVPTLDKRGNKVVTRMADIIGYARPIVDESGNSHTRLFMRGTPRFVAGSRFPDTPDSIEFTYENLVGAISDAVDALEKRFGPEAVTDKKAELYAERGIDKPIEGLISGFNIIAGEYMEENPTYYGPRIKSIVDNILGFGNKIADATPDQAELVDLAISELKDLKK